MLANDLLHIDDMEKVKRCIRHGIDNCAILAGNIPDFHRDRPVEINQNILHAASYCAECRSCLIRTVKNCRDPGLRVASLCLRDDGTEGLGPQCTCQPGSAAKPDIFARIGRDPGHRKCMAQVVHDEGRYRHCFSLAAGDVTDQRGKRSDVAVPIVHPQVGKPDQAAVIMAIAVSGIRFEKPHSLSYQDNTRTKLPPMTWVWVESNVELAGLWLKSMETSGSVL